MAEENVNPFVIFCCLLLVFLTLTLIRYVFFVFAMWSLATGVVLGYLLLGNFKEIPNLVELVQPAKLSRVPQSPKRKRKRHCSVCGQKQCGRHRPEVSYHSLNPWEGILIPEPVDEALGEFSEILLRTHVYSWYWDLSHDQGFVDQLRKNLRFIVAVFMGRIRKANLPEFLLRKCLRRFMIHLDCYHRTRERVLYGEDMQKAMFDSLGFHRHFATQNEVTEIDYLRHLSQNLINHVLPPGSLHCRSSNIFLRELLTNVILLPTAEKIADPDFVNNLLLVILDEEPLKEPTTLPSPKVVLLENFARERGKHAESALNLSAFDLIHDQTLLFPFMLFMKKEGALNVLQFCLAVEDFNRRSLAPELTDEEQERMIIEAKEMFANYFDENAVDKIHFPEDVITDFNDAVASPKDGMTKLRTASPLFRAYEHAINIIEETFVPLFHQSDEFYAILCGDREAKKPVKQLPKSMKKKFMPLAELSKLASKIKAKKLAAKEDKALAIFSDTIETDTPPPELAEEEEEDLDEYGPDMIIDNNDEPRDLSYWHITIPGMDTILERNKKIYVFVISVECIGTSGGVRSEEKWQVLRKYNEFFVLDSKLKTFHESFHRVELPPKRTILKKDLDFLNTCILPFQVYLQSLVRSPVLRGSGLLHSFLSPGTDIKGMFEPESMGQEAGRKFKSIKNKLSIERGQNLDVFLQAFLLSAEPPKVKIPQRAPGEKIPRASSKQRKSSKLYLPPPPWANVLRRLPSEASSVDITFGPEGVTEYIIYAARTILKVPAWLHHLLVAFRYVGKLTLDAFTQRYLAYKVSLATEEEQMITLIHLLRDAIFFDNDPPRTDSDKVERRDETLSQMLRFLPEPVQTLLGSETHDQGIKLLFEMLQHPKLNKQVVNKIILQVYGCSSVCNIFNPKECAYSLSKK